MDPPPGFLPKSFTKKYLGAFDNEIYITLDKWVSDNVPSDASEDLLLQMDIEGGEYATLLRASEETLRKFRIIAIEIHDIEGWGQINFFNIVEAFFEKLLNNFIVVHNHPNNCCGIVNMGEFLAPRVFELTFLRKDRANTEGFCKTFPHALDRPNLPDKEDLILPQDWFLCAPTIPPDNINYFLNHISGVIHIGANIGQERDMYASLDLGVIWIEPIPEIFIKLKSNISTYPDQYAFNALLTNLDDVEYEFKVSNNGGESSSIFDLALHKEIWPTVNYNHSIKLKSNTFSTFAKINKINLEGYEALILDTQGSELLILKGCGDLLSKFQYIKTEAPDFESYLGCCLIDELTSYLSGFGFRLEKKEVQAHKNGVGNYYDALYVRT